MEVSSEQLHKIFELCDEQNLGYITATHFEDLARRYFDSSGDNDGVIQRVVNTLDPSGEGKIDFPAFCDGVRRIIDMRSPMTPPIASELGNPFMYSTPATSSFDNHDHNQMNGSPAADEWATQFNDVLTHDDFKAPTIRHSPSAQLLDISHNDVLEFKAGSVSDNFEFDSSQDPASLLARRVRELEEQLGTLKSAQDTSNQMRAYMRDENTALISRIHLLEEQIHNIESSKEEKSKRETEFFDELIANVHKDKLQQVEILTNSLRRLEADHAEKSTEVPQWRQQNDKLLKELKQLDEELVRAKAQLAVETEQNKTLTSRVDDQTQRTLTDTQLLDELVESLTKELDDLRVMREKEEMLRQKRSPPPAADHDLSNSQRQYLESQISRYKAENSQLREERDELQAQLMSVQLTEGRHLVTVGGASAQLTAGQEMASLSREELSDALLAGSKETAVLQQYIERLTLRILDKHPSLLEVTASRPKS